MRLSKVEGFYCLVIYAVKRAAEVDEWVYFMSSNQCPHWAAFALRTLFISYVPCPRRRTRRWRRVPRGRDVFLPTVTFRIILVEERYYLNEECFTPSDADLYQDRPASRLPIYLSGPLSEKPNRGPSVVFGVFRSQQQCCRRSV